MRRRGQAAGGGRGRRVAPSPWRWALLGGLCLGLPGLGAGAVPFEVRPNPAAQDPARKTITVGYRVRNVGGERGTLTPQVTLPPGWRLLIPPPEVTLDPQEETGGLLVVLPGDGAAAGEYTVTLADGEGHRAAAQVTVAPQPLLAAAVAEVPGVVVGEPYTVVFMVVNAGNVAQDVNLSATNSAALAQELSPARLALAPGERAAVRVRVRVPPDLPAAQTVFVGLRAQGRSAAEASASSEVLPGRVPRSATHVTLPLTVSAGAGPGGAEWRVAGGTRLPDGTRFALDVGSETPWAGVERGPLTLAAGWQPYGQATPEEGDPAPGVRAVYRAGAWSAEGDWFQPGGGPPTFGVGAGWRPTPTLALAADLWRAGDGWRWDAHAGLQGTPGDTSALPLGEGWWTTWADARGESGGGWRVSGGAGFGVRGAQGLLSWEREGEPGLNVWRVSAAGAWSATPLSLGVRAVYGATLARPDPRAELGATLGYGWGGGAVSLHYVYRSAPEAEEGQEVPGRHHAQLLAETWLPRRSSHELLLDAGPGARLGYEGGLDLPTRAGTFRPAVSARYDFGARAGTVGARLGWEHTLRGDTTLTLGLGTDDLRGGGWDLRGEATRVFPGGGRVGGTAGLHLGGPTGVGGMTLKVSAAWPLEPALAPRRDVGSLSGRVTDEAGAPVAGLLLRLGGSATRTDARGAYTFAAVPLGAHYLTADAATLGADRIAVPALPARVEVRGPGPLTRDLRLVRPAAVRGAVRLPDGAARFGGTGANPAGVLLELRGEDGEVRRALTDEGGGFTFIGLPPGRYTLALAEGPLGREAPGLTGYVPGTPSTALTLAGGDRAEVTLALIPRSRTLNVQNGGSLTPLPAPPPPTGP